MQSLPYTKCQRVYLKEVNLTEQWLAETIEDEPSILGLGDGLVVVGHEKKLGSGRLDLLLADMDENRRYEVELMLGPTDESHIIRTIEYWDIEHRRYPGYDHTAVLVAEDITSRFLNVLGLFGGTIPLIAIQVNALKVADQLVLDFVRVIDRMPLRQDDAAEAEFATADRAYWVARSSPQLVELCDSLLEIINEKAQPKRTLNYNRHFIGLHDGVRSGNFVAFVPKKKFVRLRVRVSGPEEWTRRFEEAGVTSSVQSDGQFRVSVSPQQVDANRSLVVELLHLAAEEDGQG